MVSGPDLGDIVATALSMASGADANSENRYASWQSNNEDFFRGLQHLN